MLYLLVPLPTMSRANARFNEQAAEFLRTVNKVGVIGSWATTSLVTSVIVDLAPDELARLAVVAEAGYV